MRAAEPKPPAKPFSASDGADAGNPERHLAVEKMQRRFGDFVALEIEKLSIGRGHVAVIIGGSGAGKTTLLKILIGLDRPTSGAVYVDGVDITRLSDRELNRVRRKLGMVFQYSALLDSMNVLDNVAFPLREHTKLKDKEIKAKVIDKLKALGLENIEKRTPSQLSGGMRKRVALARALMLEPQVILYDEPTSGLDLLTRRDFLASLVDLAAHGRTILISSHGIAELERIASHVGLLSHGKLLFSGAVDDLKKRFTRIQLRAVGGGVRGPRRLGRITQ